MKKLLQTMCLIGLFMLAIIGIKPETTYAKEPIDEILIYSITVTPDFEDGSLLMNYQIMWKVLDDKKEGPLEWVKIGIPNDAIEEIEALSSNIDSIRYYHSGGDYIRVDFDEPIYAGDSVLFSFSFRQHHMYETNKSSNQRIYSFTPGWFDDIDVDSFHLYWNDTNVEDVSENMVWEDGEYVCCGELPAGYRVNVKLYYDRDCFDKEDDAEISNKPDPTIPVLAFLVCMPMVILVIRKFCHFTKEYKDSYTSHSGMGTYYHQNHTVHTHTGTGGGGCACACACACAGGGRAGCSKKDFYGTKLEIKRIRKTIGETNGCINC